MNKPNAIVIPWVVPKYVEIIHERALERGLSYVQVDMVEQFYTTYISDDLAHHRIFCAKVGKGGINIYANTTFQKWWHGRRLIFTQIFFP